MSEEASSLEVLALEWNGAKSEDGKPDNRTRHHTAAYICAELVVRRGQPFDAFLTLNRPFDDSSDGLTLEFKPAQTGATPAAAVLVSLGTRASKDSWGLSVVNQDGLTLKLSIVTATSCPVGRYDVYVRTVSGGQDRRTRRDPSTDVYILFNAWNKDAPEYMAGEELRQEYVLNDTGRIFYGTAKQIGSRGWNYGQFEPGILPICTSLLSGLKWSHRGDTIAVVRTISAMVNSNDDGGVLVGRWEKNNSYSGGTAPTAWNGSVEILWQYARTQKPVNYGQCWVFSGLTTTVLRCLGLPCCTVTNFASAHDTDGNLRTDVYVDSKMDMLEDLNRDSIWNFHSWTDVWMRRPDLPPGHDGWQVVDATPQEPSSGMFRCGPASLVAVKNGDVQQAYDTAFIFAEVNSDRVFWERKRDGSMKRLLVDSDGVGKAISTKAVGSNQREDITHLYKYPEGSSEEREAVRKAAQAVGSSLNHPEHDGPRRAESTVVSSSAENIHQKKIDHLISVEPETRVSGADLAMMVKVDDGVLLGSDFEALVLLSHGKPKGKRREVQVCVRGYASTYTGLLLGKVREECVKIDIMPGEEKSVCLKVKPEEYLSFLVDHFSMVLSVSVQVAKTGQALLHLRTYRLRSPRLHISLPQEVHVNREVVAELSFLNPIPCHLNDAVLRLEGAGLCVPSCIKLGVVEEGKAIKLQVPVVAVRPGPAVLLASLDCPQLPHVYGEVSLTALTPQ